MTPGEILQSLFNGRFDTVMFLIRSHAQKYSVRILGMASTYIL